MNGWSQTKAREGRGKEFERREGLKNGERWPYSVSLQKSLEKGRAVGWEMRWGLLTYSFQAQAKAQAQVMI